MINNLLPNERLESFWGAVGRGIRPFLCISLKNFHFDFRIMRQSTAILYPDQIKVNYLSFCCRGSDNHAFILILLIWSGFCLSLVI